MIIKKQPKKKPKYSATSLMYELNIEENTKLVAQLIREELKRLEEIRKRSESVKIDFL
jgi:hypothetical protein